MPDLRIPTLEEIAAHGLVMIAEHPPDPEVDADEEDDEDEDED